MRPPSRVLFLLVLITFVSLQTAVGAGVEQDWKAAQRQAQVWRSQHRTIDMHQHLDYSPELLTRAIRVSDAAGVGLGVDLTPGTVTHGPNGEPSEFEQHKQMKDRLFPGRWLQYMN